MRIAGYIEHPVLKITIFQMENKLSVKLESGLFEQVYKFRKGGDINSVDDIRQLVDDNFIAEVLREMNRMRDVRMQALERRKPQDIEDEFELYRNCRKMAKTSEGRPSISHSLCTLASVGTAPQRESSSSQRYWSKALKIAT